MPAPAASSLSSLKSLLACCLASLCPPQTRRANHVNQDLHSLRCDIKLKLGIAQQFRDDVIYFPFNVDFRGRVYPMPPNLNHMGADINRGL